jgi:hypothetical protein
MHPFHKAWGVLKDNAPLPFNVSPTPNPTWWKKPILQGDGNFHRVNPNQLSQHLGAGSEGGIDTEEGFEPEYQGEVMPNPGADSLDDARNQAYQSIKEWGMLQGFRGDELEEYISAQMQQFLSKMSFAKSWNFLKLDPTKNPQHPNAPHDTSAGQHEEEALTAQEQADEDIVQEKFDPYKKFKDIAEREAQVPMNNVAVERANMMRNLPKEDVSPDEWLFPPGPDPETPEDTERLSREP